MMTLTRWQRDAEMLCRRAPNAQRITIGTVSTTGPVGNDDTPGVDASDVERLGAGETVARVPTHAFPVLARHAVVTVTDPATGAETLYTLRDFRRKEDGLVTDLVLAERT